MSRKPSTMFGTMDLPKSRQPQGSNLSPLIFLIYVNDMPNPSHYQTNKSQIADDAGQWAVSKNIDLAVEYLQRDLDKAGFLPGIFSGGDKSIAMQISFVMLIFLLFSDQILGGQKSPRGGKLPQVGRPLAPCGRKPTNW